MVDIASINWIVIGIQFFFAIIVSGLFYAEFFTFFKVNRVKYKFNDEYQFSYKKSMKSRILQFLQFLGNSFFILVILELSFIITNQTPLLTEPLVDSYGQYLPDLEIVLGIALIAVIIPKAIYSLLQISSYWIHQLKFFLLVAFVYLPLFVLDQSQLEEDSVVSSLYPTFSDGLNLLLPTQLLAENGYSLSLQEKQQLFLLVCVVVPLVIVTLYQFLPSLFGKRKFGIFEWKDDQWNDIDESVYDSDDDTAVLLLHGMGYDKFLWSRHSRERGSTRIMDYIDEALDKRHYNTKVFAIDFSRRQKSSFTATYSSSSTGRMEKIDSSIQLNNYVWEILTAIILLKEVKEIERIHLVCHGSSGVIVRKMMKQIYKNEQMKTIQEVLEFHERTGIYPLVDKISWIAVPHFGVKAGSAAFIAMRDTILYKTLFRLIYLIPLGGDALHWYGRVLMLLGLDGGRLYDIEPGSSYIHDLNISNTIVPLYGRHEYKNAVSTTDKVIGEGAWIRKNFRKIDIQTSFEEKEFLADHGHAPWQQKKSKPDEPVYDIPPIHHSMEVFLWMLSQSETQE